MAIGGVVVGIVAKWVIDMIAESSRRKRDDQLRFVQDKRQAYGRLLAAGRRIGVAANQRNFPARAEARHDAGDAYAEISIVAPRFVASAARSYYNLLIKKNVDKDALVRAKGAFRDAARFDLGTRKQRPCRRLRAKAVSGTGPTADDPRHETSL